MAERKCEYCGTPMPAGEQNCPGCGAPNPGYDPGAGTAADVPQGKPKTIPELQAFCRAKNMPLEKMRFFIGRDEPSPRAFGIYREGKDLIVYKNKADGSRAIRYRGPDEAFAVNEIYQKLLAEHQLRTGGGRPARQQTTYRSTASRKQSRLKYLPIILILLGYLAFSALPKFLGHRQDGYYRVGEDLFYRYGTSWFMDSYGGGSWTEVNDFPYEDYGSYYAGDDYDSSWGGSDFTDSDYWDDIQDSDSDADDWDYDDYDYDDWDSGDTDWDSDW